MVEVTLTQRVDCGELTFVNLRSVRNGQLHPLFPWTKALAEEVIARAEHVDEDNGAVWIDVRVLRDIRRRHRKPLPAEKGQELADKQAEARELRRRTSRTSEDQARLRELEQRIKGLLDERRGYPMDVNPLAHEDLARAWRKQRPMPTDLP